LERGNTVSLRELTIPDRAWKEYAAAQKKLGENDAAGAVRHLQRAVELAPQFSAAWNNLGTIAYQSRKYAEAERNFREAMKQDSTAFEPVVNLGGVLLNLGKYKEALEYNLQSVQDRPDDALANAQLGINYFYLGNGDEALKYLRIAKRLDPSHFSYPQLVMAEIYLRRSDRARAIKEFEDFLARHPDAPNAASVRERIERLKR
jgi:tetratricopeptide (TPR) repeat protein